MIKIILILLLFFLFFSYALGSMQLLFSILLIGLIIIFFIKKLNKDIQISNEDIIWLLCIIVNIIGLIRSPNYKEAIIFIGITSAFILLKIALSNFVNWEKIFSRGIIIFSGTHVISTIIQYFNPDIVNRINQSILPSAAYSINQYQLSIGRYAGITGQAGANAFYITVFLAIIFCSMIEFKKKYVMIALILISFIAIILTTKSGLLIFNIITIIFILSLIKYSNVESNNKILLIFMIALAVGAVVSIGLILMSNKSSINQLFIDEDITSGRIGIYMETFELIKSSPLLGTGLYSVEYQVGIKAHNIYLQLWAELGVIGLFIYLLAIIITLKNSIKLYIFSKNNNKTSYSYLILFSIYIQMIFVLYGLSGNVLYDYFIFGTYMLSISLSGVIKNSLKKDTKA